jgi:hypothetical protein
MQTQGVANIVESDAMGQLSVEQTDDMAPMSKGSGFLVHLGFLG